MSVWWENIAIAPIDSVELFFLIFAIPFTVIFLIQLLLTFLGIGGDANDGIDDFSEEGIFGSSQFFTLKSFLAFFMIFGWSGLVFYNNNFSTVISGILAFICGVLAMLVVGLLYYFMMNLSETGNMDLKNAIGKTGKVYLPIPTDGKGNGKVHIDIQGALREVEAVTKGERLETGTRIRVVEKLDQGTLLVEKISGGD